MKSQIATSRWGGTRKQPFAFTELGATMLSAVLNSDVAIDASILVVRAFVAARNIVSNTPVNEIKKLQNEFQKLKEYVEDAFIDYNDINEDTRVQLELINQSLAELQAKNKALNKPHNPVGYHAIEERRKNKSE